MDMIIVIVMLCISFINENGGETNKWRTHHLFYKYIYIYLYVSDTVLLSLITLLSIFKPTKTKTTQGELFKIEVRNISYMIYYTVTNYQTNCHTDTIHKIQYNKDNNKETINTDLDNSGNSKNEILT